ncbi:hypothetical protein K492DRAFT_190692 [Lichtheimia hyalospora FSU 10163]|nr:hypothetical protein K492DRAFT_190692 [Lichtheimia hyalospora FSU 10163]
MNTENNNNAPSITAILLLHMEVSLIQLISSLSMKRQHGMIFAHLINHLQQAVRWILLVGLLILDNVSNMLGIDKEMDRLASQQRDMKKVKQQPVEFEIVHLEPDFIQEQELNTTQRHELEHQEHAQSEESQSTSTAATIHNNARRSPTAMSAHGMPTVRSRRTSLPTSRTAPRGGHVRSLSNNMTCPAIHATHRHTLRRIDGQRNLISVTSTASSLSSSYREPSAIHRRPNSSLD